MDNVRFLAGVVLICVASPLLALPPAPAGPYESLEDYRAWKTSDGAGRKSPSSGNHGQPEGMADMPFQPVMPVQSMPVWNWGIPSDSNGKFPGLSSGQPQQ